ncbi:uncharacterized protein K444DRAFT_635567 [Hyaloscypha bicolor E]|uniref:Uncharacterized protein n=1 Tax=Hyaloscypha bicolor E TaxID=1095630 RepID=A0A2J6SRE2_9HELO|nr:uncharacterized protein K444DRAFT_635567 [Hyaloscypha bicolor E]PMD53345.1 hypothetical protein K444DRAFT_635567 [Hyaloscypha bicolor E]
MRDIFETQVHLELSEEFMGLEALLQQRFPVFLHPENNMPALQDLKQAVKEEQKSPEGFVPLISQDQIRRMFETTYDEITAVYPMFDLPTLNRLNAEQHAVSSAHPAGNPARWAIINTWIAMGCVSRQSLGRKTNWIALLRPTTATRSWYFQTLFCSLQTRRQFRRCCP